MDTIESVLSAVMASLPDGWLLLGIALLVLMIDAVLRRYGGQWWPSNYAPKRQKRDVTSDKSAASTRATRLAGMNLGSDSRSAEKRPSSGPRWLFFSFHGRLSRRNFIIIFMLLHTGLFIAWQLSQPVVYGFDILYVIDPSVEPLYVMESSVDQNLLKLLIAILTLWVNIILGVKRLHDMGEKGWRILLIMVPFINLALLAQLFIWKGVIGANAYGPDPLLPDSGT